MAITCTARGTNQDATGGTTGTPWSPASNFAAGSMAVCIVALNNSDTDGGAFGTLTLTDSHGNTWTRREMPLYDPGAADEGITGAIFTSPMASGTLTTSSTLTLTTSVATLFRTSVLWEVVPTSGYEITYVDSGVGTGSNTTTPSITTASIAIGNIVIAALFAERNQTHTADADTTNGTWSTHQNTGGGSSADGGIRLSSQYKVVTATATQTYNPTIANTSDCIPAWIQFTETLVGTAAGWRSLNGWWLGWTLSKPASAAVTVTPGTASLVLTTFAPTIQTPVTVTPGTASLVITSLAPTILLPVTVTPGTASLVMTGLAPTISLPVTVVPGTASLILTGFAPTIQTPVTVVVGTASLVLIGFAPVVTFVAASFDPQEGWVATSMSRVVTATEFNRVVVAYPERTR